MTGETVEVPRETLEELRSFANAHSYEYGSVDTLHAIIDAGVALGMDDPTPSSADPNERPDDLVYWTPYDDEELAEYTHRYQEVKNND